MKKIFITFITVLTIITLTACSSDNAAIKEATADSEHMQETYYPAYSEIDDILADSESVVFDTPEDYEAIIKGLGFTEVDLDTHRLMNADGTFGDPTATSQNLTYKDGYFRLELSNYEQEINKETDGWVLYGTKATEIADISGMDKDAYEFYDVFSYLEAFPEEYGEYNAEYIDYSYFNVEDGYAVAKAVFFPETGNLYNLVIELEGFPENGLCSPRVIWNEDQLA